MSHDRVIRTDIIGIGLLALILFLLASVFSYDSADPIASQGGVLNRIYQADQMVYPENEKCQNICGVLGAWPAQLLFNTLGMGVYMLLVGLVALEIAIFQRDSVNNPWIKTFGWGMTLNDADRPRRISGGLRCRVVPI